MKRPRNPFVDSRGRPRSGGRLLIGFVAMGLTIGRLATNILTVAAAFS